jgi:circadian clock protein KaiC
VTAVRLLPRVRTGINGLDEVALGGLPAGRSTLVTGTAGSGKSLFAVEFLARGIELFGERGVFVSFEETPEEIRVNAATLGFDIPRWESEGKWLFVDASLVMAQYAPTAGAFDFAPLIARIEHAIRQIRAKRVSVDPLSAVLTRFADAGIVRSEMLRVVTTLQSRGVAAVLTAEKAGEYDSGSLHGVEEFVPSNVITLRNVLDRDKRRRTLEILKFRGAAHRSGEWLFAIDPREGLVVIPMAFAAARERASQDRISSGNVELDRMCGGGFFRDALVMITGPMGAGKTLTSLGFVTAAVRADERCLLCSFDETRDQLGRNAAGWGMDLDGMESTGLLRIMAEYPETASPEDHFIRLRRMVEEFGPSRLVIDTLSALERIAAPHALLEFVTALGGLLRRREVTTLLTSRPPPQASAAATSSAAVEAASLTDVTIRLEYYPAGGTNRREISVVQVRGSAHDEEIHPVTIDDAGMHIGRAPVPDPRPGSAEQAVPDTGGREPDG